MAGIIKLPKESLPFLQKIFGPAAELGELISEKIRYFRWKSSLKVMNKAEKLAKKHGVSPKEIPYKILVPLIEKASLEEESSPLIDRWAALLATASGDPNVVTASFVDTLSALSHREVLLLEDLVPKGMRSDLIERIKSTGELTEERIGRQLSLRRRGMAQGLLMQLSGRIRTLEEANAPEYIKEISSLLYGRSDYQRPAVLIETIEYAQYLVSKDDDVVASFCHGEKYANNTVSFDVLASRGLIQRQVYSSTTLRGVITVSILMATPLGMTFVAACRGDILSGTA